MFCGNGHGAKLALLFDITKLYDKKLKAILQYFAGIILRNITFNLLSDNTEVDAIAEPLAFQSL